MQTQFENQLNAAIKEINVRLDRTITRDEMRELIGGLRDTVIDARDESRRNGARMDDLITSLNKRTH